MDTESGGFMMNHSRLLLSVTSLFLDVMFRFNGNMQLVEQGQQDTRVEPYGPR